MSDLGRFEFASPGRILFGAGELRSLGRCAARLGRRALVVISRSVATSSVGRSVIADLQAQGLAVELLVAGGGEPTVDDIDRLAAALTELDAGTGDALVGIGGGSTLDRVKAAAALVAQQEKASVREYLEDVGTGRQLTATPLPWLAVPTTAGTGSEVTKNAVVSVADPPCKKSLRHEAMLARCVIVDPELTCSAPRGVTIHSGLDAITQLIESYVSRRATALTRALAWEGLQGAPQALLDAVANPQDLAPRTRLSYAALLSGLALANGGLGLAHGVAAALGSICGLPHGLACAMMLPAAMRFNLPACGDDFARLAPVLALTDGVRYASEAEQAVAAVEELLDRLHIPRRLGEIKVRRAQIPALVAGSRGNSLRGNPRDVTDDDLHEILKGLL